MRKLLAALLSLAVAASVVTACTGGGTDQPAPASSGEAADGRVPAGWWGHQQEAYLADATSTPIDPDLPTMLAWGAGPTAQRRELAAIDASDLEPVFAKLRSFADTGDFDIANLLTLWLRNRGDLDPGAAEEIRTRILAFKYWWTEPTPTGIVDDQYYWSENHQILFLADEYVAGQTFPDTKFENSGMTGREHVAHAETRIRDWIDWRARWGFSEWLSNVYWPKDVKGLLLLAELADDPALARRASLLLDVLFVELAAHVQHGTFGSTHGRSYQKNKLDGRDEPTYGFAKLAFDDTPGEYPPTDDAVLLAVAQKYRPPDVARRIARSDETGVVQLRAGIPLDPFALIDPNVEAPYGLSFEGEKGLMAFWGMGAQFAWQVAPLSVETVRSLDLFRTTNFEKVASIEPVIRDVDAATARSLTRALATQVNPGLLSQVDTYTWRSPEVMLSTAQDWRPGQRGEQDHISQATIDRDALVFTQHPTDPVPALLDPNANDGYWTGDGAMPRAAQVGPVAISIYAPQYGAAGAGDGAYSGDFEPYTHAYFPKEAFDEVVERSGWVIGRKGDGYIALWSHRPTTWRTYDRSTEFTGRLTAGDFDLVADGGPDNVWITEVGRAADQKGGGDPFDTFVERIAATAPEVTPPLSCAFAPPCPAGAGATVRYDSPSQGEITFGWTPGDATQPAPPLTVKGKSVELHPDGARWKAPWAKARWGTGVYEVSIGGERLVLDVPKGRLRAERS